MLVNTSLGWIICALLSKNGSKGGGTPVSTSFGFGDDLCALPFTRRPPTLCAAACLGCLSDILLAMADRVLMFLLLLFLRRAQNKRQLHKTLLVEEYAKRTQLSAYGYGKVGNDKCAS